MFWLFWPRFEDEAAVNGHPEVISGDNDGDVRTKKQRGNEESIYPVLTCCKSSHSIDSVFNVCLEVGDVDKLTKNILEANSQSPRAQASVIIPPNSIKGLVWCGVLNSKFIFGIQSFGLFITVTFSNIVLLIDHFAKNGILLFVIFGKPHFVIKWHITIESKKIYFYSFQFPNTDWLALYCFSLFLLFP